MPGSDTWDGNILFSDWASRLEAEGYVPSPRYSPGPCIVDNMPDSTCTGDDVFDGVNHQYHGMEQT